MGRKAREGPEGIRMIPPRIYTVSGGVSQWTDGSDKIQIKQLEVRSSDVRIWGGNPCD